MNSEKPYPKSIDTIISNLLAKAETEQIQKLVVGGVILNENRQVLVLQRDSDDFMGGLVELPSGGCDSQNLLVELIREIQEETGVALNSSNVDSYIDSFDYTSGSGKKARQFNFRVKLDATPEIILNPSEHSAYFWINEEELGNYNISDSTKQIIRQAVAS